MPSNQKLNFIGYVKMGVRARMHWTVWRQDTEAKGVQETHRGRNRRRAADCFTAECKRKWMGHELGGEAVGPGEGREMVKVDGNI